MTTALIIIDVQNAILGGETGPRAEAAGWALDATVTRIRGMLDRARAAGLPVSHVQHDGGAGDDLEVGTEGWRIRAELAPQADEPVIAKTACDAFLGTDLEARLRAAGVERVVIAGCMTPYCIDTSVRRAVGLGFDVILAGDGHTTSDLGSLPFEAIIAHHNNVLNGFSAGSHAVRLAPCSDLPGAA